MKPAKSSVHIGIVILAILGGGAIWAQEPPAAARDLFVTAGKSLVVDSPVVIQRVAVANGALAEALAVTPREVLVNGLTPGETSLIIWQQGGNRLIFDLNVRPNTTAVEAVRRELARELAGQDVSINMENNTVFLRGTVKDLVSAERAVNICGTLGRTINLLQVAVPPTDPQVLLKVRFANVDRAASLELGANIISTGAGGTIGSVQTGQFSAPGASNIGGSGTTFTLADALNVFLFRPDLNLATTIKALENKRMLETLAEPSVPAIDGRQASFLAGGEFPFPVIQGGSAVGAVTIQWREFGVRITFTPRMTPRGTLRLQVAPEVSSLDFANGLVFQGFNIPAISTRKVQTEIELESGQSFGVAGLLDNRVVEVWSKIPGLGDIPFFGKLFQSKSRSKNNTELLVLVTPEIVRPIPAGQPVPEIRMPLPFMEGTSTQAPRTPGMDVTGPVPVKPLKETIP
ncbi:MAG TPA: pilus assembly protein N-terminal domain-containing protein, partial [Bryobacteraceae bacterium]|nr:pilus assembly protein N-terminal domain-containing protein [Bryobacteraceae bacterium]